MDAILASPIKKQKKSGRRVEERAENVDEKEDTYINEWVQKSLKVHNIILYKVLNLNLNLNLDKCKQS